MHGMDHYTFYDVYSTIVVDENYQLFLNHVYLILKFIL